MDLPEQVLRDPWCVAPANAPAKRSAPKQLPQTQTFTIVLGSVDDTKLDEVFHSVRPASRVRWVQRRLPVAQILYVALEEDGFVLSSPMLHQ